MIHKMKQIKIRRTYKYRLYDCGKRNKRLFQRIDIAGLLWNHCLALHKRYYRLYKKYLDQAQLKSFIKKLRNHVKRYDYYKLLGSQAVQDVIERMHRAYQKFFKKQGGLPRFKKVKKYKSFTLKQQAGWQPMPDLKPACDKNKKRGVGRVKIHGIVYKFVKHRELHGKVKTLTVKRDSCGRLWVCFSVEEMLTVPDVEINTDKIGGFDFGLMTFLTADNADEYHAPQHFYEALGRVRTLSKAISRKVKGSHNQKKARHLLNRTYMRVADKRRDFHFKLAHELCEKYDILVFEDLNISGMKHLWGRKVSDLGFSAFMTIVKWVAQKYDKVVLEIDRFIPTTKRCSSCGHLQEMPLSERVFDCGACDLVLNRDVNAARNIAQAGASAYTGRGTVRPA